MRPANAGFISLCFAGKELLCGFARKNDRCTSLFDGLQSCLQRVALILRDLLLTVQNNAYRLAFDLLEQRALQRRAKKVFEDLCAAFIL